MSNIKVFEDKKIRTPKSNFEYYNAIGFFLYGLNK